MELGKVLSSRGKYTIVLVAVLLSLVCLANSHGHSHSHDDLEQGKSKYSAEANQHSQPSAPTPKSGGPASWETWMEAIGATVLISACPFFILYLIPIGGSAAQDSALLKILLSFASGGLLGDALLHLIPHAQGAGGGDGHSHSHSHSHGHSHGGGGDGEGGHSHDNSVGLWVLGGIVAFLIVELVVRQLRGDTGHGHSHGAPPAPATKESKKPEEKKEKKKGRIPTSTHYRHFLWKLYNCNKNHKVFREAVYT